MRVYHLPFSYTLNPNADSLEYFIVGNVGYSKVSISQDVIIPPNSRLNYENHIATYTAGLGAGVRYKFKDDFSISTGLELIYSRSGIKVEKPDDNVGDAIEGFFSSNYNDNISYEFFTDLTYKPKLKYLKPYAKLSYKLYQTKSSFTFNELSSFSTDSGITTFTLGAESNKLFTLGESYLTLEAYLNANYLNGEVQNTVKFDKFVSVGAVSYLYSKNIQWIKRYFLELNKVKAKGLSGYNIGIGFTIDY